MLYQLSYAREASSVPGLGASTHLQMFQLTRIATL